MSFAYYWMVAECKSFWIMFCNDDMDIYFRANNIIGYPEGAD